MSNNIPSLEALLYGLKITLVLLDFTFDHLGTTCIESTHTNYYVQDSLLPRLKIHADFYKTICVLTY